TGSSRHDHSSVENKKDERYTIVYKPNAFNKERPAAVHKCITTSLCSSKDKREESGNDGYTQMCVDRATTTSSQNNQGECNTDEITGADEETLMYIDSDM